MSSPRRRDRERIVRGGWLAAVAALFLLSMLIFVLPFAFPTPPPIITRFQSTVVFSPDDDGRRDVARVNLRVHDPSDVSLEIVADVAPVRTLLSGERLPRGWRSVTWDGRDDAGRVLADGEYGIRLRARRGDKRFNTSRSITIDTTAPAPGALRVRSAVLGRPGPGECRATFVAHEPGSVLIEALTPGADRALARRGPSPAVPGRMVRWAWRGAGPGDSPVAPGLYLMRARLSDVAGNRVESVRTCWVGHMAGAVHPAAPGVRTAVTVSLRRPDGTTLDPATPVTLEFRRRTGIPGLTMTPPLGARIGARVTTTAGRATITTPSGIRPDALWLVAATGDGTARALIPLGAGG